MNKLLSDEFLSKYNDVTPNWGFGNLGYIVYKRTYSRIKENGHSEEWVETIARCINGAQKIGAKYTTEEAERLFDHIFNLRCSFSGRGLWQLGTDTVDKMGMDSVLNCWVTKISNIDDFCFVFMESMFGGGVGVVISKEYTHELPRVKRDVFVRQKNTKDADFIVPDSKEGWCELWRRVLEAYLITGKSFTYSTICIRNNGEPIKTFGGIAPGPKPLSDGVNEICHILENRAGKKLRTQDVADIVCCGGQVVKSGGVRRCLPRGSLIHLERGLIPIESVKIGDSVLTQNGYEKVTDHINQGTQRIFRINTQDGWFDATEDHRMAVLVDFDRVEWKKVKELSNTDLLASSRIPIRGTKTSLPLWNYVKPIRSTTCKDINIPDLDAEMAWFLGLFQADGYCFRGSGEHGSGAYISLVFVLDEEHFAQKCKEQISRFGLKNIKISKRKNENSILLTCKSKQLSWYLHDNIKQPNSPPSVPSFILEGFPEIRAGYVSGLFDGDGCLRNRPFQVMTCIYGNFLRQVQTVLYSLGISSRISSKISKNTPSRKNWSDIYTLSIINNLDKKAWNSIYCGLKGSAKIKSKSMYSNCYPMSLCSNFDYEKKSKIGFHSNDKICIDRIQNIFGLDLSMTPIKVESVSFLREDKTFDISVENNHNFFCNGYLTHNTALILLGDVDDAAYLNLKRWDLGDIPNYRSNSNNSLICNNFDHLPSKFWDGYNGNGEPYGMINLKNARRYGRIGETSIFNFPLKDDDIIGFNPCQPEWASFITPRGIRKLKDINIGDIIWSQSGWTKVTNKWSSGIKKVYHYKTTAGSFFGTESHRLLSNGVKKEAKDCEVIDIIKGPRVSYLWFDRDFDNQSVVDGLVFGDGSVHKASNNLVYLNIGQDDQDYFKSEIKDYILKKRPGLSKCAYEVNTTIDYSELPKTYDRDIPDRFYYGDFNTSRSFLRGLYSANGSICGNRVTLKASSFKVIRKVQDMLSSLGISSYFTTNKSSRIEFSNGEYECRQSYDLNISTSRERFYKIIGFIQDYKNSILENLILNVSKTTKNKTSYDIVDIQLISEEEVFDLTVDNESHTYWTSCCNVSNCAEATLHDKEPCNLAELFLNNIETKEQMLDCAKLLYKTQKAIAAGEYFHEESNRVSHKNMRLGLGITGVCQKLNVIDEWCDFTYRNLKQFDIEYSKEMGLPISIRNTVVKPSGTLSLLAGSTPGGHPGHSRHHIRRVRFSSNDPLIPDLRKIGYNIEAEIGFDGKYNHDILVVDFPCEFKHGTLLSKDMSAIDQLNLVKKLQTVWADQAVSVTVYYKKEELPDIKKWLSENYNSSVKSVSFLLHNDHGFKQAPIEEIDEETYKKLCSKLKETEFGSRHLIGEEIDSQECQGGSCPIK